MIDRAPIVFFGEDWDRHPSTSQHLARELARDGIVLWVNSLGLRVPQLNVADLARVIRKLSDFFRSARGTPLSAGNAPKNLHVAAPIAVPALRFKTARAINRWLVSRHLRREMSRIGITDPVVVVASLAAVDTMDALGDSVRVYYCVDDYASLPGMDRPLVEALQVEALAKADVVVASSENLYRSLEGRHEHVTYLPHGVNYDGFRQALIPPPRVPSALADVTRPTVGFVGLIGEHLDFDLIVYLAEELSDLSFVMVGPVEGDTRVPLRENITYTGAVPHPDLHRYLAHFDVCIVPYVTDTPRIKYANPTKIREYLAAGRPVVSTPQPEAGRLSEYVKFAATYPDFVRAIREELSETTEARRRELSDAMSAHSWSSRAEQLRGVMRDAVARRCAPTA